MKRLGTPRGAWTACAGLLALWLLLLALTRGHGCGMGFGGLACGSPLDAFGTAVAFFGWMPVLAAAVWAAAVSVRALLPGRRRRR